jgi:2-oxoacid:acceptor oxidoreductase delta subunit (pyruvate/2-ketoisovalerate family)
MKFKLRYEAPFGDVDRMTTLPTGSWRHKRPVVHASKCAQCGSCYVYCPVGAIVDEERGFTTDLTVCKGCGICAQVCPVDAIMMVEEARRDDEGDRAG